MAGLVLDNKRTNVLMGDDEACSYGMILATGAVLPMVVKSMIELEVFEIIKRAGSGSQLSPAQIAAQLPSNSNPDAASMLDRILRFLACYDVLSCSTRTLPDGRVERLYGLAPVCKFLTKNENGILYGAFALMSHDKVTMESWYNLKDAILEGGNSFNNTYGKGVFEYTGTDLRYNKIFNAAMVNQATITMEKVLMNYKGFDDISTLVDFGGGTGTCINMIVSKYPHIKCINYDKPHVINVAPIYPGVEHVGGDMFVSVPKGDAIFMKSVCHDWSDEHCVKLLKNCYDALPSNGKLINCDFILPETPEGSNAAKMLFQTDVLLLTNTSGKERTVQEFETLAKSVGFQGFRVVCSAYNTKVMEFFKNLVL